jgi:hypothetical protein
LLFFLPYSQGVGGRSVLGSSERRFPQSFEQRHRGRVLLIGDGDDAVQYQIAEGVVQEARNGLGSVLLALVLSGEGEREVGLPPVLLGLQTADPDKLVRLFQLHGKLDPLAGRARF